MGIFGKEEPEAIEVYGKALRCLVCQNPTFYKRTAQLHGRMLTIFNVEWASPTCECMICSECGYIHWFVPSS
jgi:hypothetical protein